MRIGVPAETKANEHQVGLVPSSVKELTAKGHNVYVERGAGRNIEASDADYIVAGAEVPTMAEALLSADMVIGVVLIPGASAPQLVSRAQLKQMKLGAVLVDVAIDQGGCFETSRPKTHQDPTYVVDGIVRYCVENMPGAVPLTSSEALNNATLPFVLALAENGMAALETDSHLAAGLNLHKGKLVHPAVVEALQHVTAAK